MPERGVGRMPERGGSLWEQQVRHVALVHVALVHVRCNGGGKTAGEEKQQVRCGVGEKASLCGARKERPTCMFPHPTAPCSATPSGRRPCTPLSCTPLLCTPLLCTQPLCARGVRPCLPSPTLSPPPLPACSSTTSPGLLCPTAHEVAGDGAGAR
ncbi:unnamed protein product [Closterium sp. NIES-54]